MAARRALAVATLAMLAACGSGPDRTTADAVPTTTTDPVVASSESSPFLVGAVPEGYVPVAAGRGIATGGWGEDCCGTTEPITVLGPADGSGTATITVSATGFEGYQGGLAQAARSHIRDDLVTTTVDGSDARYSPPRVGDDGEPVWADLVVVRGDDLALRVTAPDADLDDLAAIVPAVVMPEDRQQPPQVPEPPDGLVVLGAANVDALLADQSWNAIRGTPAGPISAHAAGWVHPDAADPAIEDTGIVVMTIPGASADLAAIGVRADRVDHLDVAGRPAIVVEEGSGETWESLTVWLDSIWGDLVVARADGPGHLGADDLVDLVASVAPTDEATWEAAIVAARGGAGVRADPGHTEVMRGTVGDREWLLQTASADEAGMAGRPIDSVGPGVEPCLILSDGTRLCTGGGSSDATSWVGSARGDEPGAVSFVIVATTVAGRFRVTTGTDTTEVDLVAVDGGLFAGAVVVDGVGMPACPVAGVTVPESFGQTTVELLGPDGAVTRCLGLGA